MNVAKTLNTKWISSFDFINNTERNKMLNVWQYETQKYFVEKHYENEKLTTPN